MAFIYVIQNLINFKYYVGQAKNTKGRWARHKRMSLLPDKHTSKQAISYAIEKYGIENFSFNIIEEFETQEETDIAENFWINFFCSRNKNIGYNRTGGGLHVPSDTFKKGHIPWNKGTIGICKPNSGSFKEEIAWPTDQELIDMSNKDTLTNIAKQLKCDLSSISKYIIKNNIQCKTDSLSSTIFKNGSEHKNAKLTEQNILEIVKLYSTGNFTQPYIANKFNVTRSAIQSILNGKNWSHITNIKPKS